MQVDPEDERLQVLDEDSAVAVHDALGRAGRPGGEEHPERMLEGKALDVQLDIAGDDRAP